MVLTRMARESAMTPIPCVTSSAHSSLGEIAKGITPRLCNNQSVLTVGLNALRP